VARLTAAVPAEPGLPALHLDQEPEALHPAAGAAVCAAGGHLDQMGEGGGVGL